MTQMSLGGAEEPSAQASVVSVGYTRAGGVGHLVLRTAGGKLFVPPMRECHSVELTPVDNVVDIGAYCGTYTCWAASRAGWVKAYEPTPETYGVLVRNAQKYRNITTFQMAIVGTPRTEVTLYVSKGVGVTNSITPKRGAAFEVKVPAVAYVEAVREATVVKIDVEGAEYGYGHLAPWPTIRALIVDFHPIPGEREWTRRAEDIIGQLEQSGFEPVIQPDWGNGWTRAGSWVRR